jgi:hypothetical protein
MLCSVTVSTKYEFYFIYLFDPKEQYLRNAISLTYRALKDVIPETTVIYDTVLSNRDHWKVVQKENEQKDLDRLAKSSE